MKEQGLALLNTSIVRVYSSSRLVLQLGDDRSILPLRGNETSSLNRELRSTSAEKGWNLLYLDG